MADDWYIFTGGKEHGPMNAAALRQYAGDGRIQPDTQVRKGQSNWVAANQVQGLQFGGLPSATPQLPPDPQPPPPNSTQQAPTAPQFAPPPVPAAVPDQATKQCPFCAATVVAEAMKCRYCGETIDVALRAAEEAKHAAQLAASHGGAAASANTTVVMPTATVHHHRRAEFPHVLHLVLTVVTCGAWLPVWLIHYLIWSMS